MYSEVPNRRADRNKRAGLEKSATLLAYLLSKLINEQGVIFRLLHEKLRAGWKENLTNLSEHALPLGTSEYPLSIHQLLLILKENLDENESGKKCILDI